MLMEIVTPLRRVAWLWRLCTRTMKTNYWSFCHLLLLWRIRG